MTNNSKTLYIGITNDLSDEFLGDAETSSA
jgi:predicted GIY-YIG superfamily endonuclease